MTETGSQVATAPPGVLRDDRDTVGRPLRGTSVSIEGEEIVVRGPTVSPGYLETASDRFPASDTHRTGDTGHVDSGNLYVTGRVDERIISGGVTIDPVAVEQAIEAHPQVVAAAVVGIPDEQWGERVCALIEPASDAPTEFTGKSFPTLTKAERPKVLECTDSLPRTASGTIRREVVREQFLERSGD